MLLDRDAELASLNRQIAAARGGEGRLVVVEGPAGIGKSSLLAATVRAAAAGGVTVLVARGGPLEQDAAWGVARRLFEPVRRDPAWSQITVGAAALAERALDVEHASPASGGDAMHAVAHGLTWLAANLADRGPALVAVDDVRWADAPSLRWLAQLARHLDGLALAVVCSVRSGEPAGQPELLAELLAGADEPPVRPWPLGPAAAEALVRERLPGADASFAHACHAVTGGNPFLLRALLAQLAAEGVVPSADVARRLTSFGPEELGLWRVNAALRETLAGRPGVALLEPLLRHDVLGREPDSLTGTVATFALIYGDELDAARERYERILEIARPRGWLIAVAHASVLRAIALLRAGRVREAESDARLAFEYKLPVAPFATILMTLWVLVGALVELDDLDGAERALAAAGLGDPPPGEVPAALTLQSRARLRLAQRRPDDALADLRAAAESWRALDASHPVIADWRVDAVPALVQLGDDAGARALASEQLSLAERLGTPAARGSALRTLALAAPHPERLALLEESEALLAASPTGLERVRTLVELGTALRHAGRRDDARDALRLALDLAHAGGLRALARRATAELRSTGARPRRDALSGPASLTPAEHRVCTLAREGRSNREIAEELWVTRRTVETHLTHAYQKLGITTRGQLADTLRAAA